MSHTKKDRHLNTLKNPGHAKLPFILLDFQNDYSRRLCLRISARNFLGSVLNIRHVQTAIPLVSVNLAQKIVTVDS